MADENQLPPLPSSDGFDELLPPRRRIPAELFSGQDWVRPPMQPPPPPPPSNNFFDVVAPLSARSGAAGSMAGELTLTKAPSEISSSPSPLFAPANKISIALSIETMRFVVEAK